MNISKACDVALFTFSPNSGSCNGGSSAWRRLQYEQKLELNRRALIVTIPLGYRVVKEIWILYCTWKMLMVSIPNHVSSLYARKSDDK